MVRRFTAIGLILIMLACLAGGCAKRDDYGEVKDAEISVKQDPPEGTTIFTKLENPFSEYKYEKVSFDCAKFSFEVPDTWNQKIYNNSCIRYDAPEDDPFFPGSTCYVKCNYGYNAHEDDLDEFKHYASEFSKNLAPYITGLPFHFGGRDVWIKSYSVADEQITPSFCNDESAANIKVTKNLILVNKETGDPTSFGSACLVAAYFRWAYYSAVIMTVVPNESAENATKMMSYMLSTVSSVPHTVKQTKQFESNGIKAVVPAEFEPLDGAGNILRSPSASLASTAGMTIGFFEANESLDYVTEDYFQHTYADEIANLLANPSGSSNYDVAASSQLGQGDPLVDEKLLFLANVNIIGQKDDYQLAKKTYGTVAVWYMDCSFVERNGKNIIVAALYPPQENELGIEIEKKIIETLTTS